MLRPHYLLAFALSLTACGDDTASEEDAGIDIDGEQAADADVDNPSDSGPQVDAAPGTNCESAIHLSPGSSHLGTTLSQSNEVSATCSSGTASSGDLIYRVTLPATASDLIARVTVDEDASTPFDAVLSASSGCGEEEAEDVAELACIDFAYSESLELLALTGEVYLEVDGTGQFGGAKIGNFQIDVHTRSIAADGEACDVDDALTSRCAEGLRCVAGLCEPDSPTLSCGQALPLPSGPVHAGQTHGFGGDHFQGSCAFDPQAGAPEVLFAVELAAPANLRATTDLIGTRFDTVYLLDACQGNELACADDIDIASSNFFSELVIDALPAGSYLLVVDGASLAAPFGAFEIQLELTSL